MLSLGRALLRHPRVGRYIPNRAIHSLSIVQTVASPGSCVARLETPKFVLKAVDSLFVRGLLRSFSGFLDNLAIWFSSTMKKRRTKMNKHKLKKRRKLMRMNTKVSRNL